MTFAPTGWFHEATTDPVCGPRRVSASQLRASSTASATAPINLSAIVVGSTVTLRWSLTGSEPVFGYIIEAGSGPGQTNLANFDTNSAATTLVVTSVPAGNYYVRVRMRTASGTSAPSNEILVTVTGLCGGAPGVPSSLTASEVGSSVTLSWDAPTTGCPPAMYIIEAGSSDGLSDLGSFPTGSTATVFSASGVASGRYFVRVRSTSASGTSQPSDEAVVVVGALFSDEFTGPALDRSKWDIFGGSPFVAGGKLRLDGGATRAEIQSKVTFGFGVLTIVIESSSFTAYDDPRRTDGSFGVENWIGVASACHHSAVLKGSGHLGLLKPESDTFNVCIGDPKFQEHLQLPNWDAIRAGSRVLMTLVWSQTMVLLRVSNGRGVVSQVLSTAGSPAIPNPPLKIRLNADFGESYLIDSVAFSSQ